MPLEAIQAPLDYMAVNQWLVEIEGVPFATFSSISGFRRNVGTFNRHDGGTGLQYTFVNNLKNYGELTFTRQRDPLDPNDAAIKSFVDQAIANGTKYSGVVTKFHRSQVAFRYRFTGLLFHTESPATLDKGGAGGFNTTYAVSCDYWEEVPAAA